MLDAASLPNAEPLLFSVVIPAFNEADGLQAFHFRLATIMQKRSTSTTAARTPRWQH